MDLPRISRPCYDKAHRCPGWAGGGFRTASKTLCDGGRIHVRKNGEDLHPGNARLRLGRCNTCSVIVLPYAIRWLDPAWLKWRAWWKFRTRVADPIEDRVADLRWRLAVFVARVTRRGLSG